MQDNTDTGICIYIQKATSTDGTVQIEAFSKINANDFMKMLTEYPSQIEDCANAARMFIDSIADTARQYKVKSNLKNENTPFGNSIATNSHYIAENGRKKEHEKIHTNGQENKMKRMFTPKQFDKTNILFKQKEKTKECLFWENGNCKFGDKCRFRHTGMPLETNHVEL